MLNTKYPHKNHEIFAQLKISSDINTYKPQDLNDMPKNEDFSPVSDKINHIVTETKRIIETQKIELETEDLSYNLQQSYLKTMTSITIFQIFCVICLGLFQVYQFRKFLIMNNKI
jgi:hypothetical protein